MPATCKNLAGNQGRCIGSMCPYHGKGDKCHYPNRVTPYKKPDWR